MKRALLPSVACVAAFVLALGCSAPTDARPASDAVEAPGPPPEQSASAPASATLTAVVGDPAAVPAAVSTPPARRPGLFAASRRGIVEIDRRGKVVRSLTKLPALAARRVHQSGAIVYLTPRGKAFDLRQVSPVDGSDELLVAVPDTITPTTGANISEPQAAFPTYPEMPVYRPRTESTRVDEANGRYCLLLISHERYEEDVFGGGSPTSRELVVDIVRKTAQFVDGSGDLMAPDAGPRCVPDARLVSPRAASEYPFMLDGVMVKKADGKAGWVEQRSLAVSQWVAARDISGSFRFIGLDVAPVAGGGGVSSFLYVFDRNTGEVWGVDPKGSVVTSDSLFDSSALAMADTGGPHFVDDDVLVVDESFWLAPYRSSPRKAPGELVY